MLYATDIYTDGGKLDSKTDGLWFKSVYKFEKQRGRPKDRLT